MLLLEIFKLSRDLSSVRRYSRDLLLKEETVLEHIGFCCLASTIIANRLKAESPEIKVNLGALLEGCVVHDIEESRTGDIPRITKYASNDLREAISFVEEGHIISIASDLKYYFLYSAWKSSKDPDTIEGKILCLVDKLACAYKCWHEIHQLGNRSFFRVADEFIEMLKEDEKPAIPLLKELHDDMCHHLAVIIAKEKLS